MPKEKTPEELAEDIIEEADSDESFDDLTRGTEVYEEVDNDVEDFGDGDPEELDFEPDSDRRSSYEDMDSDDISDAYIDEDDY
jgi:hypothetical protein